MRLPQSEESVVVWSNEEDAGVDIFCRVVLTGVGGDRWKIATQYGDEDERGIVWDESDDPGACGFLLDDLRRFYRDIAAVMARVAFGSTPVGPVPDMREESPVLAEADGARLVLVHGGSDSNGESILGIHSGPMSASAWRGGLRNLAEALDKHDRMMNEEDE